MRPEYAKQHKHPPLAGLGIRLDQLNPRPLSLIVTLLGNHVKFLKFWRTPLDVGGRL